MHNSASDSAEGVAHPPVAAELVLHVERGCAGAAPQQLLHGRPALALAAAAQHADRQPRAARQRLQRRQDRGDVDRRAAQQGLETGKGSVGFKTNFTRLLTITSEQKLL